MSHDQHIKHSSFFSHWKVPQYLEKFTKYHFLISGGNFLSLRDQGGQSPHINGKKFYPFIWCFKVSWFFWVLSTKKRWNKIGFWLPPLFVGTCSIFFLNIIFSRSTYFFHLCMACLGLRKSPLENENWRSENFCMRDCVIKKKYKNREISQFWGKLVRDQSCPIFLAIIKNYQDMAHFVLYLYFENQLKHKFQYQDTMKHTINM